MFNTHALQPEDIEVDLIDGTKTKVSVFDIEQAIVSMLSNPDLMKLENLVTGLDIFTGEEIGQSDAYSEIHTGKAWS